MAERRLADLSLPRQGLLAGHNREGLGGSAGGWQPGGLAAPRPQPRSRLHAGHRPGHGCAAARGRREPARAQLRAHGQVPRLPRHVLARDAGKGNKGGHHRGPGIGCGQGDVALHVHGRSCRGLEGKRPRGRRPRGGAPLPSGGARGAVHGVAGKEPLLPERGAEADAGRPRGRGGLPGPVPGLHHELGQRDEGGAEDGRLPGARAAAAAPRGRHPLGSLPARPGAESQGGAEAAEGGPVGLVG
mmetsp:Transcript_105110/g.307158  ORF Transcript_105110/g.307158 Transcript_105110/m.307158 type:complete len:244 (-) Transcript_105110:25-756(-)